MKKIKKPTEYRKIFNGYKDILQYRKVTNLFFFKITTWINVWKPYCDWIFERDSTICEYDIIVCGDREINTFIKEYPYIEDYFIYANVKQKELELKAKQKNKEYNDRKGKITYL